MRNTLCCVCLCAVALPPCAGWHHPVHQMTTRAAILALPAALQERLAPETAALIQRYCVYPDLFPFRSASQPDIRRYCEMPDGLVVHNVSWNIDDDIRVLEYSLSGMVEGLKSRDLAAAAQHAGVLAHFLEDSTCPAHALAPFDGGLTHAYPQQPDGQEPLRLHALIERSSPPVEITRSTPKAAGRTVKEAASNLLGRVYRVIRQNREDLDELVAATRRNDEPAMNRFRQKAALAGAELVRDAYFTAFSLADAPRR